MIRFQDVSKRYANGHEALKKLSFNLEEGEMAFLTGHSGAGKSTVLRLITLMERASGGSVHIGGQDLARIGSKGVPYVRRQIGMIFQDHRLLFDRSIFDNVALPLVIAGFAHRDIGKRVRAALDMVGLLAKEKSTPIMLSGGEQQRVGIARAVVNKPPMLLADEPTGNLDPELSTEIMSLFEKFNQVGCTVLIASHDWRLIERMQKRVLMLKNGYLEHDGVGIAHMAPHLNEIPKKSLYGQQETANG